MFLSDRFMIECDHKGENCHHWYHGDCVGITPTEGRRLESQGEPFICPFCATVPSLPPFTSANAPNFTWGSSTITGSIFCEQIHKAYESIVHWRHNLFLVPFGSVGSHFVIELAKLYESYGSASAMECIALKAAMVLPPLLLQKPHRQSKSREHIKCLERRLQLWREGDITTLLDEGLTIQQHLKHSRHIVSAVFDCLNGDLICRTVIRVEGSAGPSGVDALGWRRLCTSFRTASSDLCHSLASVARHISTSFIDPDTLQPLLNCRLIALDKNPGVRPIGIGETSRRIIAKAVLQVVKQDI